MMDAQEYLGRTRSLKYEEVHLKAYADGREARAATGGFELRWRGLLFLASKSGSITVRICCCGFGHVGNALALSKRSGSP
jgi:hypothetical protein